MSWGCGREGISFQESRSWKRIQEGFRRGSGWAAVHHLGFSPDSWVQALTHYLSTKLINSLRARPDKLLINWLHCPPFLSAAAGQSPSGPPPRPSTPFRYFPNQGLSVGPLVLLLPREAQSFWSQCPLAAPSRVLPSTGAGGEVVGRS